VAFGFDHGFPSGTIGMAAQLLAGLLLERRANREAEQAETRPTAVTG
jgi:hypothetical protein